MPTGTRKLKVGLIAVCATLFLQAQAPVHAKESVTDAMARDVLTLALRNVHLGMCSEGKRCAPATEDELKSPPISIEDTRRAMKTGLMSGVAEKCGVDWSANFFAPLMRYFRHQVRMNERQLALIAIIHGTQQARALNATTDEMCTEDIKKRLSNSVAR